MGKQINVSANKTVRTIFTPASRRDIKSVFQVTQHFYTNKNNLKHYLTIGITIYYFINVPKHIVVNGNNILDAKNSQCHGVTLWWPKHEIKCSEDICSTKSVKILFVITWYVDWSILICTIIQGHLWISFCDYTTSLSRRDKMLFLESYTAFFQRSQPFWSQFLPSLIPQNTKEVK